VQDREAEERDPGRDERDAARESGTGHNRLLSARADRAVVDGDIDCS
jgi:hypothetical protein